ncbi:MAG: 2-5 ligase [Bryobacterales bacterium]|nr:2-5 ligase [Bryobacterales bacterium]
MRLFTGLDLAPNVIANIDKLLEDLRPTARIRWSPLANLHITTKFIGEWPEARLEELKRSLAIKQAPFSIKVEGLGSFPRVFWAGIAPSPELMALAAATDAALHELGIAKEDRPYSPHITLARIPSYVPVKLPKDRTRNFGAFEAREFHLYESKNSVYTKLASFPLK